MTVLTGLSGDEIYCLALKGLTPGELVIGNSVHSLGFLGGIGAGFQTVFGGEVQQITDIISEGRHEGQTRLESEAARHGAQAITGVTSELRTMQGNTEFLSVGSCAHGTIAGISAGAAVASTNGGGQQLYCMRKDTWITESNFAYATVTSGEYAPWDRRPACDRSCTNARCKQPGAA